jgi:glycosyltransferase involved in cell wall biosynthesis
MFLNKTVSVIFPAYNEEESIENAVSDFFSSGVVDEVIVVDNNSRDRTAELVRTRTKARLVQESRQGYGSALMRGLKEAKSDYIIMSEPDGTFIGRDVVKLLAYAADFDMVMGTRTSKAFIRVGANMWWFLRLGNIAVAKLLQFVHRTPSLTDCGCTMRLIGRQPLQRFVNDLTVTQSHFLPHMVILAKKSGVSMVEIPVNYHKRKGTSKITGTLKGAINTGLRMIGVIVGFKK